MNFLQLGLALHISGQLTSFQLFGERGLALLLGQFGVFEADLVLGVAVL